VAAIALILELTALLALKIQMSKILTFKIQISHRDKDVSYD
jgi:hypothetical protein